MPVQRRPTRDELAAAIPGAALAVAEAEAIEAYLTVLLDCDNSREVLEELAASVRERIERLDPSGEVRQWTASWRRAEAKALRLDVSPAPLRLEQ